MEENGKSYEEPSFIVVVVDNILQQRQHIIELNRTNLFVIWNVYLEMTSATMREAKKGAGWFTEEATKRTGPQTGRLPVHLFLVFLG